MLVFIPLAAAELAAWARSGHHRPASGYAVTPALRSAFGFTPADDEDAEHTVLHIAGLAALRGGRRLVAVAEAPASAVAGAEFGDVRVGELGYAAVTALFADASSTDADGLSGLVAGRDLATVWDDPRVAEFLGEHELLWHGPTEWQALV